MTRGDDRRDPLVIFRAPATLKTRLYAHAEAEGRSVSDVARDAIEAILPAAPGNTPQAASQPQTAPRATQAKKRRRYTALDEMCEHRVRVGSFCRRCNP